MNLEKLPETSPKSITDKEAKKMYKLYAVQLNKIGRVNILHQDALINYCEAWSRSRRLQAEIEEYGEVLTSDKGNKYINPAVNAQKMAQNEMARQAKELGLDSKSLLDASFKQESTQDPNDPNAYLS